MCSYGAFSRNATAPKRDPNAPKIERRLTTYEKRHGVSLKRVDIQFVKMCEDGLVDTIRDRLAGPEELRPTSIDVCVRSGTRSQGNRITTALHAAAKGGHAETCRVLLESGATPSKRLELGRILTPIHVATNVAVVHILLDHGSIARSNDPRVPDPAWYHRTQHREDIAGAIDEYNEIQKSKRQRRVVAKANLQRIWNRLNGMVVGIRRIRRFQLEYKERFYCPNSGKFVEIANQRFYSNYRYSGNDLSKTIVSERTEYIPVAYIPESVEINATISKDSRKRGENATNIGDVNISIDSRKEKIHEHEKGENIDKARELAQEREKEAIGFDMSNSIYSIGDRVRVREFEIGKIRFIGPVKFAKGVWVGVELEHSNGKNNGTVNGHQYFTCKKKPKKNSGKNYGLFVRLINVEKAKKKYSDYRNENIVNQGVSNSAVVKSSGGSARNAVLSLRNNRNTANISGSSMNAILALRNSNQ
eukprot:g5145.t1